MVSLVERFVANDQKFVLVAHVLPTHLYQLAILIVLKEKFVAVVALTSADSL